MAHRGLCWAQHDMTTGSKQRLPPALILLHSRFTLETDNLQRKHLEYYLNCRIVYRWTMTTHNIISPQNVCSLIKNNQWVTVALLINMFCEVTELNTYLSVMSLLSIISCTVSEIKETKTNMICDVIIIWKAKTKSLN